MATIILRATKGSPLTNNEVDANFNNINVEVLGIINTMLPLKAPLASPALTGTPTAPTAALNTNTTQLATTAFVIGQSATASPLMDGVGAVGSATKFAREDHVHPTDTTRAPLASPALTGTPTAPTADLLTPTQIVNVAAMQGQLALKANLASPALTGTPTAPTAPLNTTTTQIASTAFVIGQASTSNPLMDGTVAIGTGTTFARADHVHPTDSTRAPLASPALTGTPTVPTAAHGTSTTQIASTEFVNQNAVLKTADTGAAKLPVGTTAQRDGAPVEGMIRYNSTLQQFEGYFNGVWQSVGGGQLLGNAITKGIFYNAQTIAENLTVASGTNAMSAGPISIADGFEVTVSDGCTWTVV